MKTMMKSDANHGGVFSPALVGELITFSSMRNAWHSIYRKFPQYVGGNTAGSDNSGNDNLGNMPPVDPSHPDQDYSREPAEENSPLEEISPIIQPDIEGEALDPEKEVSIDERTKEIEDQPGPMEYGEDRVQRKEFEDSPEKDSGYEEQDEVPEREERELGNDGVPS